MKLISGILLFFLIFNFGCSDRNEVVVEFWGMGVEGESVSKLIPQFERENPGIKVRVQQIPWSAAHEKLLTAYASETLPDVFQLGNTWIPEFSALNGIENLNSFIHESSIVQPEKFFAGIWETNVLDSMAFGVPWYVDTRVVFYRKDILASVGYSEMPTTWSEVYKLAVKIKEKCGKSCFPFFFPTNEWQPAIIMGMQNGSTLLKNNNSYAAFSEPQFRNAFQFLINFYHEKLSPPDMQQILNLYQAFEEGYFAMYITGPWNVTEMKKRLSPAMQKNWMTAPLPSFNDEYPGLSMAGGASVVMSSFSQNKSAAWKLMEFLSSAQIQLKFYKMVGALPSVKSVWEDSVLSQDKYMKAFYLQLDKTKATPKIPEWEQIVFAKIQQYVEMCAFNKITPTEALSLLDKDANQILEKRRWLLSQKEKK